MPAELKVLVIGDKPFDPYLPDLEIALSSKPFDMDELMEEAEPTPDVIVWLEPPTNDEMSVEELAQLLRTVYVTQPIFALTAEPYDEETIQTMVKNGFSNIFAQNDDAKLVSKKIFSEYLPKSDDLNDCLLVVGNREVVKNSIPKVYSDSKIIELPADDDVLTEPIDTQPAAILYIQPIDEEQGVDLNLEEVGQILLTVYPQSRKYLVYRSKSEFNREDLKKNGYTDIFISGIDDGLVKKYLQDAAFDIQGKTVYQPVSLVDLTAGQKFEFDLYIYMRLRNKFIKFVHKGDELEEKRLKRLNEMNGSVFVPHYQMPMFYSSCADYLKKIGSDETVSSTEKSVRLQTATRELFSNLFSKAKSFKEGDDTMDQVNGIVDSFLGKTQAKVKNKVKGIFSDMGDLYGMAANVSSMAATFSMATGLGNPQDLATAGLLMDLGLMKLPPEIGSKQPEDMTFEEFDVYKSHPDLSLEIINEKKLKISEEVRKLIRDHHEYFNGKGYPRGFSGAKISSESALLVLSDLVVNRIAEKRNETSEQMIKALYAEMKSDFDNMKIEPTFLKKFIPLFVKEK